MNVEPVRHDGLPSYFLTCARLYAPDESFDDGAFTATLPDLVSMLLTQYGTPSHPRTQGKS